MTIDFTSPVEVLARTLWGEARSGGYIGMQSVANSVMNRVRHKGWWGDTPLMVCLKPWQYSTWNPHTVGTPADANYLATIAADGSTDGFVDALTIAALAIGNALPDVTAGSDSYYAASIPVEPDWAKKSIFTFEIMGQRFYRTV